MLTGTAARRRLLPLSENVKEEIQTAIIITIVPLIIILKERQVLEVRIINNRAEEDAATATAEEVPAVPQVAAGRYRPKGHRRRVVIQ